MTFDIDSITILVECDAENINAGFEINNEIGKLFLLNSIYDFREYLVKLEGEFINGMNMNYRNYVTLLLLNINKKFQDEATKEVILPSLSKDQVRIAINLLLEENGKEGE